MISVRLLRATPEGADVGAAERQSYLRCHFQSYFRCYPQRYGCGDAGT
jgi:hypothetical protein